MGTHTEKVDIALQDRMQLITGCIRSTHTDILPVLSGIVPPDIPYTVRNWYYDYTTPATGEAETDHLLHKILIVRNNSRRKLKLQKPLSGRFYRPPLEVNADTWAPDSWRQRWTDTTLGLRRFIVEPTPHPPSCDLPRADRLSTDKLDALTPWEVRNIYAQDWTRDQRRLRVRPPANK